MTDADEMFLAVDALRKEAHDHHQNLLALSNKNELTGPVLTGAVVDTASLLADLSLRLANILSPEAAAGDEAADAEEDDEEGDELVGLEPEEAAMFRRLLHNYASMLQGALASPELPAESRAPLDKDQADIKTALDIVDALELEPEPEA